MIAVTVTVNCQVSMLFHAGCAMYYKPMSVQKNQEGPMNNIYAGSNFMKLSVVVA